MDQKELMQSVKDYRNEHSIFQKSLDQRSDTFQSITYDGPPFASGTPHFGHGLVGAMKDTLLRYKTMKGYKVNRDRGWDCHGLPVEKAVEKDLGLDGKKDIEEKLGVEKFTEACRAYVGKTSDEWRIFVDNIGRWADMDHAYYTMNLDFMESIIRVFQNMYNQNLVYKGFKVQRCCPSCATSLSNSEVNEGYKDRQDAAITIKFKVNDGKNDAKELFEYTSDGLHQLARGIIKKDGAILMLYHKKWQGYALPGGKLKKGQTLESAIEEELTEELGVKVSKTTFLGDVKKFYAGYFFNLNMFEVEISGEPTIMESDKHSQMVRVHIIPSDNKVGFAIKIEETIIDDDREIIHQFHEIYTYQKNIVQELRTPDADVNILAWTTTPRTLPSNMFLAVGAHIHYYMVFDKSSKEYYILAENLVKQYYKNPDEYILINILQGEDLVGITYEPLFPYINQSKIEQKYKDQFFKVIAGEFVSTEDGTGIVHIAPGFGMEDFEAVAQFMPREYAKDWLFIPVNEYGEFTDDVPDWQGQSVFDVNKEVITRLKTEKKLIGQKSYSHSYPHCWRCETPLISRALTSWFIKEPELTKLTVPNAEKISFVPESVKNRFIDTLKSAPDWNLSRNRYRGSPLPIWENQDNLEEKIVIGNLDELYHHSKTGSKNLTKHILVRHGEKTYTQERLHDNCDKSHLTDHGKEQAKQLTTTFKDVDFQESVIVVSPLSRSLDTILPYIQLSLSAKDVAEVQAQYLKYQTIYLDLWNTGKALAYLHDTKKDHRFQLYKNIYMDFRIVDFIVPEFQDKKRTGDLLGTLPYDQRVTPLGESLNDVFGRVASYLTDITTSFPGKTIITISHKQPLLGMRHFFRSFDYNTFRKEYSLTVGSFVTHYRDNERQTEVDLHKPYVDNYRFTKDGHTYKRVPEVMDCWFESGSMPFGQAHYTGIENGKFEIENSKFVYPADFIIEGLDQTRGRFRTLHVCGNAVMKNNSFNNVIINGLILAEDGRKMSKSLNNYPDPSYIFERYGADAYRLYLLASPGVRAEPFKFSEKGVDQVYKDFTSAIINAYKFFETYATIDNFSFDHPQVYFLRHAESAGTGKDPGLSEAGQKQLEDQMFVEHILRINPDFVYVSPLQRTQQTAQRVQEIMKMHRSKDITLLTEESLSEGKDSLARYHATVKSNPGKTILIVSHEPDFELLRTHLYQEVPTKKEQKAECILLPVCQVTNELDKRILSALHEMGLQLEKSMDTYILDDGAKTVLEFVDKLNNRFIRRSRRRFRASGMDNDKQTGYTILFHVLETYMKCCAPFAPFLAEYIYLELQKFKTIKSETIDSVHLDYLPLSSSAYVNKALLEEIATVRKIISLGLFIRSKNKIAVKQPLKQINVKL